MIENFSKNEKNKKGSRYRRCGCMLESLIYLPLCPDSSTFPFTTHSSFVYTIHYVPNFSFERVVIYSKGWYGQTMEKPWKYQKAAWGVSLSGTREMPRAELMWSHQGLSPIFHCRKMLVCLWYISLLLLAAMWDNVEKRKEEDCLRCINI